MRTLTSADVSRGMAEPNRELAKRKRTTGARARPLFEMWLQVYGAMSAGEQR
jgi:hypothetical protein